jgi:hypothetical protein
MLGVFVIVIIALLIAIILSLVFGGKFLSKKPICAELINPGNANDLSDGRWEKYNCDADDSWKIQSICDSGDCNSLEDFNAQKRCLNNRFLCNMSVNGIPEQVNL